MSSGKNSSNQKSQIIKVLSFDLDDTLWPCLPTIERAEKLLYQWLSENVPVITQHYDINQLRDKRRTLIGQYPELAHDLSQLRIKSFEVLKQEFSLSDDWISPAFGLFYQARQKVTLFDDVVPVLDVLKNNYQMVSVTNGNADTVETGVDHWFDFALNSAAVGKMKSEPEIYHQVQQLTNSESQQMMHIGDHPLQDIVGAKLAGVFAVWLNRQNKPWPLEQCQPDAVIQNLHELPILLTKIAEKRISKR